MKMLLKDGKDTMECDVTTSWPNEDGFGYVFRVNGEEYWRDNNGFSTAKDALRKCVMMNMLKED